MVEYQVVPARPWKYHQKDPGWSNPTSIFPTFFWGKLAVKLLGGGSIFTIFSSINLDQTCGHNSWVVITLPQTNSKLNVPENRGPPWHLGDSELGNHHVYWAFWCLVLGSVNFQSHGHLGNRNGIFPCAQTHLVVLPPWKMDGDLVLRAPKPRGLGVNIYLVFHVIYRHVNIHVSIHIYIYVFRSIYIYIFTMI